MNSISCHGFVNNNNPAVIISCHRKSVSYFLQTCFVLHYYNLNAFKNVHIYVRKIINAEHLYRNDLVIIQYSRINSVANALKSITIVSCLHTEFVSM